jgi:hypothetical protein
MLTRSSTAVCLGTLTRICWAQAHPRVDGPAGSLSQLKVIPPAQPECPSRSNYYSIRPHPGAQASESSVASLRCRDADPSRPPTVAGAQWQRRRHWQWQCHGQKAALGLRHGFKPASESDLSAPPIDTSTQQFDRGHGRTVQLEVAHWLVDLSSRQVRMILGIQPSGLGDPGRSAGPVLKVLFLGRSLLVYSSSLLRIMRPQCAQTLGREERLRASTSVLALILTRTAAAWSELEIDSDL